MFSIFYKLYSQNYLTEDEFWKMYNRDIYSKIREKFSAVDHFPDLYQKTHGNQAEHQQLQTIASVLKSLISSKKLGLFLINCRRIIDEVIRYFLSWLLL
jgi:hypothetical protein